METKPIHVNDSNFDDEVTKSDIPVIVDFWAEWCGPCTMFGPIFEKAAGTYAGKVKFVKLNVDEASTTAAKFGIRSIPTIVIFNNGEKAAELVGALPEAELAKFIDSTIG